MISFFKKYTNLQVKIKKKNNCFSFKKNYIIFSKTINFLSEKEIEASRRVITRSLNRVCKVKISISKKVCVTRKNLNMRMGKGRGKAFKNLHPVYWNTKLLTVNAPINNDLIKVLKKASKKISCIKKIYYKNE